MRRRVVPKVAKAKKRKKRKEKEVRVLPHLRLSNASKRSR